MRKKQYVKLPRFDENFQELIEKTKGNTIEDYNIEKNNKKRRELIEQLRQTSNELKSLEKKIKITQFKPRKSRMIKNYSLHINSTPVNHLRSKIARFARRGSKKGSPGKNHRASRISSQPPAPQNLKSRFGTKTGRSPLTGVSEKTKRLSRIYKNILMNNNSFSFTKAAKNAKDTVSYIQENIEDEKKSGSTTNQKKRKKNSKRQKRFNLMKRIHGTKENKTFLLQNIKKNLKNLTQENLNYYKIKEKQAKDLHNCILMLSKDQDYKRTVQSNLFVKMLMNQNHADVEKLRRDTEVIRKSHYNKKRFQQCIKFYNYLMTKLKEIIPIMDLGVEMMREIMDYIRQIMDEGCYLTKIDADNIEMFVKNYCEEEKLRGVERKLFTEILYWIRGQYQESENEPYLKNFDTGEKNLEDLEEVSSK